MRRARLSPPHNIRPCTAGDVVLDCGANVGSFTRMAAPVLGLKGVIYAIEPIPDVCVALRRNIQGYQKWAQQRGLKVAKVVAVQAGAAPELLADASYRTTTARSAVDLVSMCHDSGDAAVSSEWWLLPHRY